MQFKLEKNHPISLENQSQNTVAGDALYCQALSHYFSASQVLFPPFKLLCMQDFAPKYAWKHSLSCKFSKPVVILNFKVGWKTQNRETHIERG